MKTSMKWRMSLKQITRENMNERVDRKILKRFGHVGRTEEGRLAIKVYGSGVEGGRARGRPSLHDWLERNTVQNR